ncbi:MAG TPA: phage integrase N-terminal SAM-like domain-containing protein [Rhodocyclaceae bacterium]|jgi:hypothetical protein
MILNNSAFHSSDMAPQAGTESTSSPKLLDQLRARIRVKHYSIRTEDQYVLWVKRFVIFKANVICMRWGAGGRLFVRSGGEHFMGGAFL